MSRELDALVAEALGWNELRFEEANVLGGSVLVGYNPRSTYAWCQVPHYSTDIAAAFPLFEWLDARGIVRLSNGDGDSMDCDFVPKWPFAIDRLKFAHVTADTWCKAICYAFLAAKGTECTYHIESG